MILYLVSVLLVAACGIAVRPVLRRTARFDVAVTGMPGPITLELPVELQHLPEPPVLPAAAIQLLDRTEIFRRLTQLSLGVSELGHPLPEHDQIVAAALAAISDVGTQRRYAPRRPHLQIGRAHV